MPPGPPLRDLRGHRHYVALRRAKRRSVTREHLHRRGAHAVGIGRKTSGGVATNALALIYYVEEKARLGDLAPEARIPRRIVWQALARGPRLHLATDVVVLPRARYQQDDPQRAWRPVIPGGVSVGMWDGGSHATTGTLGGWVADATDGEVVMLSNQHIFTDRIGVGVHQQALGDFGNKNDPVGKVKRSVPISDSNRCDCAIASPNGSHLSDCRVLGIGPGVYAVRKAALDLPVQKFGQVTGLTRGQILDADWSGDIEGDYFDDCFRVGPDSTRRPWSDAGDSGSLVFARAPTSGGPHAAVGLHFAGSGTDGIVCRIENVFRELKLEVLPPDAGNGRPAGRGGDATATRPRSKPGGRRS